jgi:OOP family OmpA-OmpF porin
MAYVSILKRFGASSGRSIIEGVSEPVESASTEAVELQMPVPVISYDIDSDGDGVFDRSDKCMDSPFGIKVDDSGCSIIAIDLKGVNFEKNSYRLTKDSELILDEAASLIIANPALQKIEVQAHTDSKGTETYNLRLSEQRAASVRDYLVSKGIEPDRLSAKGYGEAQPIADNDTEEGKAKNRRVELKVLTDAEE